MGQLDGVLRTRVGYAGGTTKNPTYHNLGDHIEAVQVDFDPSRITFEELLTVFWESHNPTRRVYSRQYISALFYHDEKQRHLVEASWERAQASYDQAVLTEILPAEPFYTAEDYHQKYYLQSRPQVHRILVEVLGDPEAVVHSTLAARVNGYLGRYSTAAETARAIAESELSSDQQKRLLEALRL